MATIPHDVNIRVDLIVLDCICSRKIIVLLNDVEPLSYSNTINFSLERQLWKSTGLCILALCSDLPNWSWETLGQCWNLSDPQFPHLWNGVNSDSCAAYLTGLSWGQSGSDCKVLSKCEVIWLPSSSLFCRGFKCICFLCVWWTNPCVTWRTILFVSSYFANLLTSVTPTEGFVLWPNTCQVRCGLCLYAN